MKIAKERGRYLEKQARKNIVFAALFGVLGTALILYSFFFIYFASIPYGVALYFLENI